MEELPGGPAWDGPPRDQAELEARLRSLPHVRRMWFRMLCFAVLLTLGAFIVLLRSLVVGVDQFTGLSVLLSFMAVPLWLLVWKGRVARRMTDR